MGLLPEATKGLSDKFRNDIFNQILAICWVSGWLLHNLTHMALPIGMGELVGCDHLVAMPRELGRSSGLPPHFAQRVGLAPG